MKRRAAKEVRVGNLTLGGNHPIVVQSMLNIPSADVEGCVKQARELQAAGCEMIRIAVPDINCVKTVVGFVDAAP